MSANSPRLESSSVSAARILCFPFRAVVGTAFRGGPRGAAPFASKGAGLDSTQPKTNVSCHPERSEGSHPQRLATRPKHLGSANIRVYPGRASSCVAIVGTAFRGGPWGTAPFASKGAGLDSTQPKTNVSCHPEHSEGSQPQRLATQPKYLGSADITAYPETASSRLAVVGNAFRGGPLPLALSFEGHLYRLHVFLSPRTSLPPNQTTS